MWSAAMLALAAVVAQSSASPVELRAGPWRAWLDSPGGELPFGLQIQRNGESWKAWLINGDDRAEIPRVQVTGEQVVLSIPHYDSTITAEVGEGGTKLDGEWRKRGRNDKIVRLGFHATAGAQPPAQLCPEVVGNQPPPGSGDAMEGRWLVKFEKDEGVCVAVWGYRSNSNTVVGTILTPTGDYGFLAGQFCGDRKSGVLRLSEFDGAHAFLLVAKMTDGRTLQGDFWSGDTFHDTWTAKRDDEANLPDAFAQTQFSAGVKLDDLKFPDLQGRSRSLGESAFAGKALIIEVFGSWCPNCNDASRYLVELHRKHKDRGLSIVGLAFEYTGDFQRDAEQVKAFAKYHEIEYPLLLAGVADREKASAALPIIDKLRAYPTIILLDGQGKGRAVYTGFSGPATGEEYTKFRARFEALLEETLGSP